MGDGGGNLEVENVYFGERGRFINLNMKVKKNGAAALCACMRVRVCV